MTEDYSRMALQFGELVGAAQGMTLKLSHLTREGMEFVFENATSRTRVRILPKVYVAGKVIVDAINDLTMVVEVSQFELKGGQVPDGAEPVGGGKLELPYSTWFFEGDFM